MTQPRQPPVRVSHDADHNGPGNERANSITVARLADTCPSDSPAAAIASAYWSRISCSKSSASCAVRNAAPEDRLRTTASPTSSTVHSHSTNVELSDTASGIPTQRQH
jgi:hypothetical protein